LGSVKVVAIIGYTRTGSTILDNILGELDGFFSTGELHYLWERGLLEGRLCGCGRSLLDCEVWSQVLLRAFGDRRPDPKAVVEWQRRTIRTRHTWRLLRDGAPPGDGRALDAYQDVADRLYRAIAEVTGARIIVDSSKRPSDGALLRRLPSVDPYFVHLIRDPRGVVYSWRRQKRELDVDRRATMPRQGLLQTVMGWAGLNLAADAVRRRAAERSLLVRYEDLVAQPRQTIAAIAKLVGESEDALPLLGEGAVRLSRNHTVAGNPSRFTVGVVEVRPDTEWRMRMPRRQSVLVTGLALPLLVRYGYPVVAPAVRKQSRHPET
jgi:Sulfotransferase family